MKKEEILEVSTCLRSRHGEMLPLEETAHAIRKPAGFLKITLYSSARRRVRWAQRLLAGCIRLERRVYFRPEAVATVIVLGDIDGDVHE